MGRLAWALLAVVGCSGFPGPQSPRDTSPDPSLPDGTKEDCAAMCANLETLGGCGMVPVSMSCPDACVRQMSTRDQAGDLIVTLRPACLAEIDDCGDVPRCELDE